MKGASQYERHTVSHRKRTKIVATIGPASQDMGMLRAMIRAGMDVARINFSHGDHETHARNITNIRRLAEEESVVVAILADIPGPKLRLGDLVQDPLELTEGDRSDADQPSRPGSGRAVRRPAAASPTCCAICSLGERLLLDDGAA